LPLAGQKPPSLKREGAKFLPLIILGTRIKNPSPLGKVARPLKGVGTEGDIPAESSEAAIKYNFRPKN